MQHLQSHRAWTIAVVLAALFLVGSPRFAQAQTVYWVTNTNSSGSGSLVGAVESLQPSHTGWQEIRFSLPAATTTIALSGPLPPLRGARVRVTGVDHTPGVIIDGNYSALFRVEADSTTTELDIRDLRLQRGGRIGGGGCLAVLKSIVAVRVDGVHFDRCRGYLDAGVPARGGAIRSQGGLSVVDSVFTENSIVSTVAGTDTSDAAGGAIWAGGSGTVVLMRNLFQANRIYLTNALPSFCASGHGGAIALTMADNADTQVLDSTFIGNHSACRNPAVTYDLQGAGDGGAIVLYGRGDYRIERNYFENNTGRRGGAVMADQAHWSNLHIANNTFYTNKAHASGGGAAVINCCATYLDHNTFVNNTSLASNYGSQFAITGSPIYSIRYNAFSGASPTCSSSFISFSQGISRNAYSDGGCGLTAETSSLTDLGAMSFFEPPAMTGGEVLTMRPVHTSVVVDYGPADEACATVYDGRGVPRPLDGNGDGITACDIGAVEASFPNLIFANGFN